MKIGNEKAETRILRNQVTIMMMLRELLIATNTRHGRSHPLGARVEYDLKRTDEVIYNTSGEYPITYTTTGD